MKTLVISFLILILGSEVLFAQLQLPLQSPKASVSLTVGFTKITVNYGSPAVKGRKIWGVVVPYDRVWRTGANEATIIEFDDTVKLKGHKVAPGKYSLFTIPTEKEWTIIINKNFNQWGSYQYDENLDILRFKVSLEQTSDFNERLFFTLIPRTTSSAELKISWEKVAAIIPIETNVIEKAITNIRTTLGEDRWIWLTEAAAYYNDNNYDLYQAIKWINESIAIKDYYWNNWVKAKILANQKRFKDAIYAAERSIKVGEKDSDSYFVEDKERVLADITLWKSKK